MSTSPPAKQRNLTKKTKKRLQKYHNKRVKAANKMNKKLDAFDDWFEGLNPALSTDDSSCCSDDDTSIYDDENIDAPCQEQQTSEKIPSLPPSSPRRTVQPRGGELEQMFASPGSTTKSKCPIPPSPRASVLSPEQRQKARAVLDKRKSSQNKGAGGSTHRRKSVSNNLSRHLDASGKELANEECTDHTATTADESDASSEPASRDEGDPKLCELYGSGRDRKDKSSSSSRRGSMGSLSRDEGLSSGSTHSSRSRGGSSHTRVYSRSSTTSSTAQAMVGLSPGANQRRARVGRGSGHDPLSRGGSEHSRRNTHRSSNSDSLARGGSEHCRSSSRNLDLSRGSEHRRARSSSRNLLPRGSGHSTASSLNGSTHHERPQIPMTPTSTKTPALQKRLLEKKQQQMLLRDLPWSSAPLNSSDHERKKTVSTTTFQRVGEDGTFALPSTFQVMLSPSKAERKEKLRESYMQAKNKKLSPRVQNRKEPTTPRRSLLQEREHQKQQRQQSTRLRGKISDSLDAITGSFDGEDDFFGDAFFG